jgi:hypothetical protein
MALPLKMRLDSAPVWLLYFAVPPECRASAQLVQVPVKTRALFVSS